VQEETDDTPSISQRAYLIAKSLSELTGLPFIWFVLILVIFLLIFFHPPSNRMFPDFVKVGALAGVAYTSFILVWFIIKARRLNQNFDDWERDYIEQVYTLVFDTTIPKGNTTAEKILNLAMAVFPELRPDYIPTRLRDRIKLHFKRKLDKPQHIIVSESMNYKVSPEYSVDLGLKTQEGYFIVKDFKDKVVSFEELRYLAEILGHKFRDIFRVICVAKAYDESFLNEISERLMTEELKANFKIDLLVEEKVGYSVLWTS
jgi:hypothetical protein